MKIYDREPVPGDWNHSSGDCDAHGVNIAFARAKGVRGIFHCVACLLGAAEVLRAQEEREKSK